MEMNQTFDTLPESSKTKSKARFGIDRILGRRAKGEEFVISLVPYVVLTVLVIWLAILEPRSVEMSQIHVIVNLTMPLVLIAIGQSIVILTGGLDLSVGGVLSVVSIITALNMNTPSQVVTTSLLIIALSWIPGLINGLLIVYAKIQPFIATLSTWFILGGLALYIRSSPGGFIDPSLAFLSTGRIIGIPVSIIFLILSILFGIWFQHTRLGFEIQSIGSDRESAFHSGVRIKRIEILAYVLCGVFTTLGAIVLAGQSLSGDPKVGDAYILPSFAAAAIGGARLAGGWASIVGSIVGALAISYLISVTYALGMPGQWALIFEALLLILSVFFQYLVRVIYRSRQEG
jgi:ribose transport system permease protein